MSVSFVRIQYGTASSRCQHVVDSCLTGVQPQTDALTFSYSYHHLLTIRIRTVTFSAARFARSCGEHVGHSITQREHGVKEANEVSGNDIFSYPHGGLISVAYMI